MVILPEGRFPGLSSSGLSAIDFWLQGQVDTVDTETKNPKTPPVFPWVFPPWPAIFFDEAHLEAKEGPPQSEEAIFVDHQQKANKNATKS